MTNNLALQQMAASQTSNLDVTINGQSGELDAAITASEIKTITSASGNAATVTKLELQRANVVHIKPDGGDAPDGPITITLAEAFQRGSFTLVNDTLETVTFEVSAQPDTAPLVAPGASMVCQVDGASVRPVGTGDVASANLGTPGTGVEALEFGDNYNRVTKLVLNGVLPAIIGSTGGDPQAVGLLVYTFPVGVIEYAITHMDVAITQTQGNINADTPEVGIGSVIANDATSTTLGAAGADKEDYVDGLAAANCTGTKTDKSQSAGDLTAGQHKLLIATDARTIHFNAADGWASGGDTAPTVTGDIWISWRFLGA